MVRHRATTLPSAEQDSAFEHDDVVALVADLVASPDLRLVKLASKAALVSRRLDFDESYSFIGPMLYDDDELGPIAQRVFARAQNIGNATTEDARLRRRGAMLERLVFELVDRRLPGKTYRERDIELHRSPRSKRSWTNSKDVVAEGTAFEVYECKGDGMIDVGDIDQLCDVVTTGVAEGTDVRATAVTFGSEVELRVRAVAWRLTEPIQGVPIDRILELRREAPARPITPVAA